MIKHKITKFDRSIFINDQNSIIKKPVNVFSESQGIKRIR
jgi:hypothetical protein